MRPTPSPRRAAARRARLPRAAACLLAGLGALAVAAPPPAEAPPHQVRAPHYGDGLFHHYQGRHFSALTGLMVSQHFGRLEQQEDEAELLRGALLLSYGMPGEAGAIFARLTAPAHQPPLHPATRDKAWFYLAKLRHPQGRFDEAEAALNRIAAPLPPGLEDERLLLHANLLIARGDAAGAAQRLAGFAGSEAAALFARYNLGIAQIHAGNASAGATLLEALGTQRMEALGEESRSLRDQANLALGFAALRDERAPEARRALERVRLASPLATKALLGFGWAAVAAKQPERALVAWQELLTRDDTDPAVQEARIALPYALAEMGAPGQALARYREALGAYGRDHARLDASITAVRSGRLLAALIERNPGEAMGWFWQLDTLPELPHTGHLAALLAQHPFQEAFKGYRDLVFLAGNLAQWRETLGVYRDMLANRRQAFAERLPRVRAAARLEGLDAAPQRALQLADALARVEAEGDAAALADASEQAQLLRLQRARAALAQLAAAGDAAGAELPDAAARATLAERQRRVAGALQWQLSQA
ncbi:MAG: hypothetical protein HY855_01275, partial [Burkholderiales bacterium]|nr:hypothetical protein [Burkholderiales bacterium]